RCRPFRARLEGEAENPVQIAPLSAGLGSSLGFQVRRMVRWKNEISYITRIPAAIGERGHHHVSLSPTLVGVAVPPPGLNLEVKPYGISTLASDSTVTPRIANELSAKWGGDVKYGITKSLTADFTYNTDFAQVEADQQQVNLTRFSLFYPEKRDFFLENAGTFVFGNTGNGGGNGGPLVPFFSRRIGLNRRLAPVPILGGARVTGKVGRYDVGFLTMKTDKLDPL